MSGRETWQQRKDRIRREFLQSIRTETEAEASTTPETPGSAASPAVDVEVFSVMAGVPPSRSSATSATATASTAHPTPLPVSSTPADSTSRSSAFDTVWTASPLGWLNTSLTPSIVDPNGSLIPGLPPAVHASLLRLATARQEPVEAIVQQIVEFFVEEEDERAEGTLADLLTFYIEQYVGAGV